MAWEIVRNPYITGWSILENGEVRVKITDKLVEERLGSLFNVTHGQLLQLAKRLIREEGKKRAVQV